MFGTEALPAISTIPAMSVTEQAVRLGPEPQSGHGNRRGEFHVDIKNPDSWCIFDLPAPS
ncbi:MAG: hypothetical protein ACLP7Q_13150 [Isosphaeraceae bacterium]